MYTYISTDRKYVVSTDKYVVSWASLSHRKKCTLYMCDIGSGLIAK